MDPDFYDFINSTGTPILHDGILYAESHDPAHIEWVSSPTGLFRNPDWKCSKTAPRVSGIYQIVEPDVFIACDAREDFVTYDPKTARKNDLGQLEVEGFIRR